MLKNRNSVMIVNSSVIYYLLGALSVFEVIYIVYDIHAFRYLITGIILFYLCILLFSDREHCFNTIERAWYFRFFLFWIFVMFGYGLVFSATSVKDFFFSSSLFLSFTFPFLYRIYRADNLSSVLFVIYLCDLFYLVIAYLFLGLRLGTSDPYNVFFVEYSCKYLAFPNLLMILLFPKLPLKYRIISIAVLGVSIMYAVFEARRALVFTLFLSVLFSFVASYKTLVGRSRKIVYFIFLFAFIVGLWILYVEVQDTFLRFFLSRMDSDSRDSINDDFFADMSGLDILIGRGVGGQFSTATSALGVSTQWGNSSRDGIETGFLDYILKGGVIYLGILVFIYLKAIYNGLFKSNNYISKALALFILLHLFELYPSGTPLFNLRYCVLWFCVFACYDNFFLKQKDYDIIA